MKGISVLIKNLSKSFSDTVAPAPNPANIIGFFAFFNKSKHFSICLGFGYVNQFFWSSNELFSNLSKTFSSTSDSWRSWGIVKWTGHLRPSIAVLNAKDIYSGILSTEGTSQEPLVTGLAIPTWSNSCIAPLPIFDESADPAILITGASECIALANPATALAWPGVVDITTPGFLKILE